jgi:hypothetical protein
MALDYLVGQPTFTVSADVFTGDRYAAPHDFGATWELVQEAAGNTELVENHLRQEYLVIVHALRKMGVSVSVIIESAEETEVETAAFCKQHLGCRLAGVPGFPQQGVLYPRDLYTKAGQGFLVNSEWVGVVAQKAGAARLISTPFGMGGRTLSVGNTVLIPERISLSRDPSRWVTDAEIRALTDEGYTVGVLPLSVGIVYTEAGITDRVNYQDHLDRYHSLVRGKDGCMHLLTSERLFGVE